MPLGVIVSGMAPGKCDVRIPLPRVACLEMCFQHHVMHRFLVEINSSLKSVLEHFDWCSVMFCMLLKRRKISVVINIFIALSKKVADWLLRRNHQTEINFIANSIS